jgi:hypothetical protein
MVGAKPRASLTSELRRLLPRRYAAAFNQQSCSMSSHPVHRSLPPTRRFCSDVRIVPGCTRPKRRREEAFSEVRIAPVLLALLAAPGSFASDLLAGYRLLASEPVLKPQEGKTD